MDDAYGCLLPRAGMPPQYYEGYYYACALNYEDIGRPASAILEDEPAGLLQVSSVDAQACEAALRAQLLRMQAALSVQRGQPSLDREVAGQLPR